MGKPARASDPDVQANINKVIDKALAAGKYVHFGATDPDSAKKLIDRGVQLVEITGTALFVSAGKAITKLFQ